MKYFSLLAGAVLFLSQCQSKEIPQADIPLTDTEFRIKLHQTVPLMANNKTEAGEITFMELNDSRCPADAMCIRQGAAVTTFRVTLPQNQETQIVRLFIGDFMPNDPRNKRNLTADTVTISSGNNTHYRLMLQQVGPYPGTGQETPQATLKLIRN
ncbi:MAG: hypothetical protein COW65_14570 [Cytophagales bacterium CG18_big_fil_WC_8_21_14_2_50_42_9]|nr:MAG: hypothetical protein COW65_14570 [Cytophagales bacterium CG18_big_fil_WC_8_21_14_2_50_42_9]